MSLREEENEEGRDLKKPLLHTGSWYRMNNNNNNLRKTSSQAIRDASISVFACVLVVALGPIQFGFTVRIHIHIYIYILFCHLVPKYISKENGKM